MSGEKGGGRPSEDPQKSWLAGWQNAEARGVDFSQDDTEARERELLQERVPAMPSTPTLLLGWCPPTTIPSPAESERMMKTTSMRGEKPAEDSDGSARSGCRPLASEGGRLARVVCGRCRESLHQPRSTAMRNVIAVFFIVSGDSKGDRRPCR